MTKEHQMRVLYDKFLKTAGKTKKGFCIENNVSFPKYKYWERKFAAESKTQIGFISIENKSATAPITNNSLVLEYPNGVKISTTTGDLSLIGQLIALL